MSASKVLIIGGGIAGTQTAIELASAQAGIQICLVERAAALGGHVGKFDTLFPYLTSGPTLVQSLAEKIKGIPSIKTYLATEVLRLTRRNTGFTAMLKTAVQEYEETFTAVVLATGYKNYDAVKYGEYGYGRYPGVITSVDFEEQFSEVSKKPIKNAVFVKCVGARDRSKGMPYCSKLCCMYTAKQAMELKKAIPTANIYVFYMDIRANVDHGEEFVRNIIETYHINYVRGRVAKVFPNDTSLTIRAEDTLMGVPVEVEEADLVVLATAMTAHPSTVLLAQQVGATVDEYGFLAPTTLTAGNQATLAPGVFYAGACGFPADVKDTLTQGSAAAAGVLAYLMSEFGKE